MNIEDIFILFLKKHRKYSSYKRQNELDIGYSCSSVSLIDKAFYWEDSEEGHDYWIYMQTKWDKLLLDFNLDNKTVIITHKLKEQVL